MKKFMVVLLIAGLIASAFTGCAMFLPVTQEEAEEATGVFIGAYFVVIISMAFGSDVEGVTLDDTGYVMTFDDYDLTDLAVEGYDTMSGTAETDPDTDELIVNVTFEGSGPVKILSFTTDDIESSFVVMANFQTFTIGGR